MCDLNWVMMRNTANEDLVGLQITEKNMACVAYYYGMEYNPEFRYTSKSKPKRAVVKPRRINQVREYGTPGDYIFQRLSHGGTPFFYNPESVEKHLKPYPEMEKV